MPPNPIIKPLKINLDIPPLELEPIDCIESCTTSNETNLEKAKYKPKSNQYLSPFDNTFLLDTKLPKILELEREDSSALPNAPRDNESKYLDEIFQDFSIKDVIDEFPESEKDSGEEPKIFDIGKSDENFSLEIRKSGGNKDTKVYRMNRDVNYTSTSGGSRKDSVTNIGKLERKNSPQRGNNSNVDFEFNPKMFAHSLSDGNKLQRCGNNYGDCIRKYSEPVHSNGGQTIFGHQQELKIIQIKKAIRSVQKDEDGLLKRSRDNKEY